MQAAVLPQSKTLFLTAADLERVFSWSDAVAALRAAYAAPTTDAMMPPRVMARGAGKWLRVLAGLTADTGLMGAKLIAANLKSHRAAYLIPLFDQETADLLALIDGNLITGFRTAATSALATDLLAPAGSLRVGVLGSGFEAQHHIRALAAIRDLSEVTVFSPNPASRARFAEALADLALPVATAGSAEQVVRAPIDVLICAARARNEEPVFDGRWLQAGTTVVSIGSTLPEQREVDPQTISRAGVIVADMLEEVMDDTGDMLAARAAGIDAHDKVVSLADVVAGRHPGRTGPDQIALYKSVGGAIQDLAVAAMCMARAREMGLGTELPVSLAPVAK